MFGQRLQLARKAAGLSKRELAKQSPGVSERGIGRFEAGQWPPGDSILIGLSRALGVSMEFLLSRRVKALVNAEWRKHSTSSVRERAEAELIAIGKLEHYLAIETIFDIPTSEDPFVDLRVENLEDGEAIEAKARAVRGAWGLGNGPIPSMIGLLESRGVKVIEGDLPERIGGMTCRAELNDAIPVEVILVARRTGVDHRRFNLAHELARGIIIEEGNEAASKETAMDRFAGAFLIPRGHLENEVRADSSGPGQAEILRLKRVYGVSAAAMLVRLRQTGILSNSIVGEAFRTYARGWRREEPEPINRDDDFTKAEQPRRYENLVWRALRDREIPPVRAARMLGVPLSVIERQIDLSTCR